jgi:hypothetical protein
MNNEEEAGHWQYYETDTLGTPVSPAFSSQAQLAAWLSQYFGERQSSVTSAA